MIKLNNQQQKAVENSDGALLIIAGAGSGKTRCIIERTAFLIEKKGVSSDNILIVTFTNKAANEIKQRLLNRFQISTPYLWVGTFHSICSKILRSESSSTPFTSNFSIIDETDKKSILKRLMKEFEIDSERFSVKFVKRIISRNKGNQISVDNFFEVNEKSFVSNIIFKLYKAYQNILLKNNSMDFDDLLFWCLAVLQKDKKVKNKYQTLFKYIMIDEFQDTNPIQLRLTKILSKKWGNICVVGDDDQSIYSFRGANINNILNFEQIFSPCKVIKLQKNYRSGKNILNLANSLIRNNSERYQKKLFPSEEKINFKPIRTEYHSDWLEANCTVELIEKGLNIDDTAILCRVNSQTRLFETALRERGIAYEVRGGTNYYERAVIKNILAFIRVICNKNDDEALLRIINFPPRGIGKITIKKLLEKIGSKKTVFDAYSDGLLEQKEFNKIKKFLFLIISWQKKIIYLSPTEMLKKIVSDINLFEYYEKRNSIEDYSRIEDIKEFIVSSVDFSEKFFGENKKNATLLDFLNSISILTQKQDNESVEKVKVLTIHSAKGLEFENVFIVGLEDGLLPHQSNIDEPDKLQEERRLLYVAITRAKNRLYLSSSKNRRGFHSNGIEYEEKIPSRFILDFDKRYYTNSFTENTDKVKSNNSAPFYNRYNSKNKKSKKLTYISESGKYYKIGQTVKHETFGIGKILNVNGEGVDAKLSISFNNGNLKKIIGNYVKILHK